MVAGLKREAGPTFQDDRTDVPRRIVTSVMITLAWCKLYASLGRGRSKRRAPRLEMAEITSGRFIWSADPVMLHCASSRPADADGRKRFHGVHRPTDNDIARVDRDDGNSWQFFGENHG